MNMFKFDLLTKKFKKKT